VTVANELRGKFHCVILFSVGIKNGITGGFATYVLFVVSNLYVQWYTMIPAAVVLGFGAAVLWSAQGELQIPKRGIPVLHASPFTRKISA